MKKKQLAAFIARKIFEVADQPEMRGGNGEMFHLVQQAYREAVSA